MKPCVIPKPAFSFSLLIGARFPLRRCREPDGIQAVGNYVALLRGINVGRAKRVAMSDLRTTVESLGGTRVRTILNSGNVCFRSTKRSAPALASGLKDALRERLGVNCAVLVLDAGSYRQILATNPLTEAGVDPARFLVAFVASVRDLDPIRACVPHVLPPDRLAVGEGAAYLWCAAGILDSPVLKLVARAAGETFTTRNWSTAQRVRVALESMESDED